MGDEYDSAKSSKKCWIIIGLVALVAAVGVVIGVCVGGGDIDYATAKFELDGRFVVNQRSILEGDGTKFTCDQLTSDMEASTRGTEWSIIGLERLDMDVDSINTILSCIANNENKPTDGYLQFQFNAWNLGKGTLDTEVLD